MEVTFVARFECFDISPSGGTQMWQKLIPADREFYLECISIMGLASNLCHGVFRLEDASRGRLVLELPLIYWAVRPRRAMTLPWRFRPASTVRMTMEFREPITPAMDLLGRPRPVQKVCVILVGRDIYKLE